MPGLQAKPACLPRIFSLVFLSSSLTQLLNLRPPPPLPLPAGAADLAELKAHPFFAGVDWERLRELPAPRFIAPDLESIGSDAGSFDWELQVGCGWVAVGGDGDGAGGGLGGCASAGPGVYRHQRRGL